MTLVPDLIWSVELRLGVDDGGRVLVERRHEVRQPRGLPRGRLLHRGPQPASAALILAIHLPSLTHFVFKASWSHLDPAGHTWYQLVTPGTS